MAWVSFYAPLCVAKCQVKSVPRFPLDYYGHGFKGYPKGRNVERALGFSLTGTVSTLPNLANARAQRASNDCRATRSLFS